MEQIRIVGLDIAKSVFQVHGVDAEGEVVVRRRLKRSRVLPFFASLEPCRIGIEACATAHFWARELPAKLVVGAMAVIRHAQRNGTRRPWLVQLMARRTTKVAAVALANKTARMVWAIMVSGECYREPVVQAA